MFCEIIESHFFLTKEAASDVTTWRQWRNVGVFRNGIEPYFFASNLNPQSCLFWQTFCKRNKSMPDHVVYILPARPLSFYAVPMQPSYSCPMFPSKLLLNCESAPPLLLRIIISLAAFLLMVVISHVEIFELKSCLFRTLSGRLCPRSLVRSGSSPEERGKGS